MQIGGVDPLPTAPGAPHRGFDSAAAFARLRTAHDDVLAGLAVLDAITAAPQPDPAAYPLARWKLSRASRDRRAAFAAIAASLKPRLAPAQARALDQLSADDFAWQARSALHIRRWTPAAVAADWPGYCEASDAIRSAMRDRIRQEQALLYPLLDPRPARRAA
jgi:hypothetical protein